MLSTGALPMPLPEPDWGRFRIDYELDPEGVQLMKIKAFMRGFIDWRADVAKEPAKKPAKKRGKKQ